MPEPDRNHSPLIRKLESVVKLTDDERAALAGLPMQIMELRADQDIVREGDRPSRCCLLVEGFTCLYKVTREGKRQIMNFHVPGDIPDLQSLHLRVLDSSLGTVTPCRVGFIQHETLHDLCGRHPRIASALWRETLIDASIFREWMVSIGQREAYSRIAHLFCEWVVRMRVVGLVEDHTCTMPLTQAEIGDALGVTAIHVNRTLRSMRKAGVASLQGNRLSVLDWEALKHAGEFNPTYLHLQDPQLAA